jgi:predicted metal-binding protein
MSRIAILYCKRIKDHSCIACMKCFKGMKEKNAEFAAYSEIDLVAMTDCGDCPGLISSRVKLLMDTSKEMGRAIEVLHLGTCIKSAMNTSACPLDFGELKVSLEKSFGIPVILGTHSY